jgi:hypothetical protein
MVGAMRGARPAVRHRQGADRAAPLPDRPALHRRDRARLAAARKPATGQDRLARADRPDPAVRPLAIARGPPPGGQTIDTRRAPRAEACPRGYTGRSMMRKDLQKVPCALPATPLNPPAHKTTPSAERCRSGRSGRSRKPLWVCAHRGFESHPLRHLPTRKRSPNPAEAGFFRCFRGLCELGC